MAINTAVSASTGVSPSELVFGSRVRLPLDALVGAGATSNAASESFARSLQ